MKQFEEDYATLVHDILRSGEDRQTRNAITRSLFGMQLKLNMQRDGFPLIQGREMYPKGIFGEFAAFVRGPKHLEDFEKFGCNYWEKWAKDDGSIDVDYGNAWTDFDGYNQLEALKESLKNNPTDRRMIISSWRPNRLDELDLPCCHYAYQFYVRDGEFLDMIWIQRSVDMMIGLPSDMVLAGLFIETLCNELGFQPGIVTMQLGDCHVYSDHQIRANDYVMGVGRHDLESTQFTLLSPPGTPIEEFHPEHVLLKYDSLLPIKFKLHG